MKKLIITFYLFLLPGLAHADLRDRDIFIAQYTLDWFSNHRSFSPPVDTADLWPTSPTKQKILLDWMDAQIESSIHGDPVDGITPESKARDIFILKKIVRAMKDRYGVAFDFRDQAERDSLKAHLINEFANHQSISLKYPTGEPLSGEKEMVFTEHPKMESDTKYNKTRIYRRQP